MSTLSLESEAMMTSRLLLTYGFAFLLFGLSPAEGAAQTIARATPVESRRMTAHALEAEASSLASHLDQRIKAARLFVAAAQLRPIRDTIAVLDLSNGAHLFYYAGDRETALPFMIEAARRADVTGAPFRAANLYATAALIAAELSDLQVAREMAAAAATVVDSRRLSESERRFVVQRLRGNGR